MTLVAGIDGGQTTTVAVVLDSDGAVLGRGVAGPADHVGEPATSERAALACEHALARALAAAGLDGATPLAATVVGLSGYEGAWHGREPRLGAERVSYVHDAPAALAGAVGERPAGVVIAGTGSVGYGEGVDGTAVTVGGYGYLFGDGGSAFAIAREALAAAMHAADDGRRSDLGEAALAFFDVPDLRAFARAVSLGRIARPEVAGFARLVLDAARFGDPGACGHVGDAATALADLAAAVARALGATAEEPLPVALVGGVGQHPLVAAQVARRLDDGVPVRLVAPLAEPAVGAALLACDLAGLPRPALGPA